MKQEKPNIYYQSRNIMLWKEYMSGNREAMTQLILKNKNFIYSFALIYQKYVPRMDIEDLYQEATIGFIKGVESFNPDKGAFSTYIGNSIKNRLHNQVHQTGHIIKIPEGTRIKATEYKKILGQEPNLSDDELCKKLETSKSFLDAIKNAAFLTVSSLSDPICEDGSIICEDIIPDNTKNPNGIVDAIADQELAVFLKNTFSPLQYYILYHLFFSQSPLSQQEIAQKLKVSRNNVHLILDSAKKKLEIYFRNDQKLYNQKLTKLRQKIKIDKVNPIPFEPEDIIEYLFVRDFFTEKEQEMYKKYFFSDTIADAKDIKQKFNLSFEDYKAEIHNLIERRNIIIKSLAKQFECFRAEMFEKKSKIFTIDIDSFQMGLPLEPIKSIQNGLPDYLDPFWDLLKPREKSLLSRCRKEDNFTRYPIEVVEREINMCLFGLSNTTASIQYLYKTYIANKDLFTLNQIGLLDLYFSLDGSYVDTEKLLSNSNQKNLKSTIKKLEKIALGIIDYKRMPLTQERYFSLRERVLPEISRENLSLLDSYFGFGCERKDIQSIARSLNISKEKAADKIDFAASAVKNFYCNIGIYRKQNRKVYIPFVEKNTCHFSPDELVILKKYYIEFKCIDEIAEELNVNTKDISNLITRASFKMDRLRFGIGKDKIVLDANILKECIEESKNVSFEMKKALLVYLNTNDFTLAEKQSSIPANKIENAYRSITKTCRKKMAEVVEVTHEDIEREVLAHPTQSIISLKQKQILAMIYKIKSEYNLEGKKYSIEEVVEKFELTSKLQLNQIIGDAINFIRQKKAGIIHNQYDFMDRIILDAALKDPHLPLEDKEKEVLAYIYGVNGYPCMTMAELSDKTETKSSVLMPRFEHAAAKVFKYLNDEIPGYISFQEDVEPNLKYFAKSDQEILRMIFQEHLHQSEIAERVNLSETQVKNLTLRLRYYLQELLNGHRKGMDFDYIWTHIDDEDIHFSVDKEQAKRIFYLYHEKRMNSEKIIEILKLDFLNDKVHSILDEVASILMQKKANMLPKIYTYEEIRTYYEKHASELSYENQRSFKTYFKTIISNPNAKASSKIICFLLEEEHPDEYFRIFSATKEDVIKIIKEHRSTLSWNIVASLMEKFEILPIELLDDEEKIEIVRILEQFQEKRLTPVSTVKQT